MPEKQRDKLIRERKKLLAEREACEGWAVSLEGTFAARSTYLLGVRLSTARVEIRSWLNSFFGVFSLFFAGRWRWWR